MSDRPSLSADVTAWQTYLRDVQKLQGDPKSKKPEARAIHRLLQKHRIEEITAPFVQRNAAQTIEPIPKKTRRKIAHGHQELDATLDLHGLTQDKAFATLWRFIKRKHQEGARQILIITGKGVRGESVLRSNLPFWCADERLKPFVAALHEAAPNHGGAGAFYLRLRARRREF